MVVRMAFLYKLCLAIALVALSACSPKMLITDIHDPYESTNRQTHAVNKALDKRLFRPLAVGYSRAVNDTVETMIGNVASNLSVPSHIVNDLLQGELISAVQNTAKFGINSTSSRVGSILSQRGQFAGMVDSVLYESADSYAQMRGIFLQQRRFEIGGQQEDVYFDPYDDLFDEE